MAEVQSSMLFFARDDLYEHEKPYQLKYIPDSGVPASNYRVEKREGIRKYLETVVQSVKTLLGADKVQVFNYAVCFSGNAYPCGQ